MCFRGVFFGRMKVQSIIAACCYFDCFLLVLTWAKRLKRVFNIDIESCEKCGGAVKIIASIEDPAIIQKVLAHLDAIAASVGTRL